MPGKRWDIEETALVKRLYGQGVLIADVITALRGAGFRRSRMAVTRKVENEGWHRTIQTGSFPIWNDAPKLTGDWLILSDCHIPYHDSEFCNNLVTYALKTGIRQVLLNGDFIDWAAFSPFGSLVEVEADAEIASASQFIEALCSFDRIVQLTGNHEVRLIRTLNYQLKAEQLLKLYTTTVTEQKIQVTDYHWCQIETALGRWRISHPKNAHMNPCSVARRLVAKHNCHVAIGHDHICGMMLVEDGKTWAISTGVCLFPDKLEYVSIVDNTRWMVARGALILRSGSPELLVPRSPALH